MQNNKVIGSILILVGTSIGAGILALPMVSASSGFLSASLLMIGVWALMTITALLILEVNLFFPAESNSFDAMSRKTLGKIGQLTTWISFFGLLYALLAAYTAGTATLLTSLLAAKNIYLPTSISATLFIVVFGGAVFWSTSAVDYSNRFLMSIKGLLLVASITLLMPYIDMVKIFSSHELYSNRYLGAAAPIFLVAFGLHLTIPSIRNYVGNKPKELRFIVLCSMTVPLIVYLLWLLTTLGVVPLNGEHSFSQIKAAGNSVNGLIAAVDVLTKNSWVMVAINGFSNVAMTTSFLGVSLGLFDFLADGLKRSDTRFGRFQTALVTFVPPLIFALFYPKGFIIALSYAAIFESILCVILPALMAYKFRTDDRVRNNWLFNRVLLLSIMVIGIVLIIL